jgi:hypothetical protein
VLVGRTERIPFARSAILVRWRVSEIVVSRLYQPPPAAGRKR